MDSSTSFLSPSPSFWLALLALFVLWVVLVLWPFVQVVREGRVLWALAVVFLAPFGGLAWFIAKGSPVGPRQPGTGRA